MPGAAPGEVDPADFAARMWRGAEVMIFMRQEAFGEPLDCTSQELAGMIAFVRDRGEQQKVLRGGRPRGSGV